MTDQNKAIVRRFFEEVWNKNNLSVVDELYARLVDRNAPPAHPATRTVQAERNMFRSAS
jgi:hypothetical protein